MHSSTQPVPVALPPAPATAKRADVAYQAFTVAAIMLLLGSLWIF